MLTCKVMSLRVDRVQLDIVINNDESRRRMRELEDSVKSLVKERKHLTEGTPEWNDNTSAIQRNQRELDNLKRTIGIAGMTMQELVKHQRELSSQLNLLRPNTPEWKTLNKELQDTRARMNELRGTAKTLDNDMNGMIPTWKKLGTYALAAFSIGAITGFINKLIEVRSEFEKYGAILKNTLGSSLQAWKSMYMLVDFAAVTPYQLNDLTESYVKLVNRGFKPTKEEMGNLGDLAASMGRTFGEMTEALIGAQVGQFRRLREFGIVASKHGDMVAMTFKGVKTEVAFTDSAIQKYILSLGKLSGVAGTMTIISETLTGRISNMKDAWDELLNSMGEKTSGIIKGVVSAITSVISGITEWMNVPLSEKLTEEQGEMNILLSATLSLNEGDATRNELLKELCAKYPEYLSGLDIATVKNKDLLGVQQELNKEFEKQIALQANKETLSEVIKEKEETIKDMTKRRQQLADLYEKGTGKNAGVMSAYQMQAQLADKSYTVKSTGGQTNVDLGKMSREIIGSYNELELKVVNLSNRAAQLTKIDIENEGTKAKTFKKLLSDRMEMEKQIQDLNTSGNKKEAEALKVKYVLLDNNIKRIQSESAIKKDDPDKVPKIKKEKDAYEQLTESISKLEKQQKVMMKNGDIKGSIDIQTKIDDLKTEKEGIDERIKIMFTPDGDVKKYADEQQKMLDDMMDSWMKHEGDVSDEGIKNFFKVSKEEQKAAEDAIDQAYIDEQNKLVQQYQDRKITKAEFEQEELILEVAHLNAMIEAKRLAGEDVIKLEEQLAAKNAKIAAKKTDEDKKAAKAEKEIKDAAKAGFDAVGEAKTVEEAGKAVINSIRAQIKAQIAEAVVTAALSALKDVPFPFNIIAATAAGGAAALLFNNLVPQFAEGRYNVIGAQDGQNYNNVPYVGPAKTGLYGKSLVGEKGTELIVDAPTLRNVQMNYPEIIPLIMASRVPQHYQGSYGAVGQSSVVNNNYSNQDPEMKAILLAVSSTMDKLEKRLDEPINANVSMLGRGGFIEAQKTLDKIYKNVNIG